MRNHESSDFDPDQQPQHASFFVSLFFGVVFMAVAAGVAYAVFSELSEETPHLLGLTITAFVAILFGSIGLLILAGVVTWSKSVANFDTLTSLSVQWQKGKIYCSTKPAVLGFCGLGLVVLLSLLPSMYVVCTQASQNNLEQIWWAGTLCIPLGLIGYGLKSGIQLYRFGESICTLPRGPATIGGTLQTVISTTKRVEATGDFKAELSCKTIELSESDTPKKPQTKIIWQNEQVAAHHSNHSVYGIAFNFPIPVGLPLADAAGAHAQVKWILTVAAPTKGPDYRATFQVPIVQS